MTCTFTISCSHFYRTTISYKSGPPTRMASRPARPISSSRIARRRSERVGDEGATADNATESPDNHDSRWAGRAPGEREDAHSAERMRLVPGVERQRLG